MTDAAELTVVAPWSVQGWYAAFCGESSHVRFIGESDADLGELADSIADAAAGLPVRLLSGHDSLQRDEALARALRAHGLVVTSQSPVAVRAGVDKVVQKRMLEDAGIPTPAWGYLDVAPANPARTLVKKRCSTQSRGLHWWAEQESGSDAADAHYWERFLAGTEYSVVVHRGPRGSFMFPPVWKGATAPDLTPPWRRLRVVPRAPSALNDDLASTAARVADLLDVRDFLEVEFIVAADGTPWVIDLNPRISGTMRIVAMATGLPILDAGLPDRIRPGVVPVRHCAAEVPYDGPAFVDADAVASSRLTCVGESWQAVRDGFARHHVSPGESAWPPECR